MSDRVPDPLVDQLRRGELPPERADEVRARLAAEPGGLARLAARAPNKRRLWWLVAALATAGLSTALALAWTGSRPTPGADQLLIHRLGTGRQAPTVLSHGATASAGDQLQLSARLAEPRYLAILSVDGAGVVTVHEPATAAPERELQVPRVFTLDAAPDFERFFLFSSPDPLDAAALHEGVYRLGQNTDRKPSVPPGVATTEIRLKKPARERD